MRKKGWKKPATAMLVAFAIAATSVLASGVGLIEAKADDGNLLVNGDFEGSQDAATGWNVTTASVYIDNSVKSGWGDASTGTNILVVQKQANSGDAAEDFTVTQTIESLSAGTYTLSFACKGKWAEIYPILEGVPSESEKKTHNENWDTWDTYTVSFTLQEDKTNYVVGVKSSLWSENSLYFDDFSLAKTTSDPDVGDTEDHSNDQLIITPSAITVEAGESVTLTAGGTYGNTNIADLLGNGYAISWWADSWNDHRDGNSDATVADKNAITTSVRLPSAGTYYMVCQLFEVNGETWATNASLSACVTLTVTAKKIDISGAIPANITINKIENLSENFIKGVDVSSYISEKASGVKYYDFEGNELSDQGFFDLLKSCGVNYVRIRVWNDPYDENGKGYGGGTNDLEKAEKIGKWASAAGMKVLIDFHYSDFWTDPGKQYAPKDWASLSLEDKTTALHTFTKDSLNKLITAGVDVGMVQVGNETNAKFCGETEWTNICTLFNAGCSAVREVEKTQYGEETVAGSKIMIALHFADPQNGVYPDYAKHLNDNAVDYDVFASSYYPFFHGTTENLTSVLNSIATNYGKKVMVAETSWATTLEDGDGHDNQIRVGSNDTPHYEFSVMGQATEVRTVMQAVADAGDNAIGVFYWEPAWIPVQYAYDANGNLIQSIRNSNVAKWEAYGSGWASSYAGDYQIDAKTWYGGSAMDNQAMFDMYGHPLESLKVFNYVDSGTYVEQKEITSATVESVILMADEDGVLRTVVTDAIGKAQVGFNDTTTQWVDVSWNTADVNKVQNGGVGTYKVRGTVTIADGNNSMTKDTSCRVIVLPYNYMPNYSLEDAENGWEFSDSNIVTRKADENSRTGSYALKFYDASAFDYTASKEVTIEKSGTYNFGGYIQGGDVGDDAVFTYSIQVGDADTVTATASELKGWKTWIDVSIPNVQITGDNTTVKITVTGAGIQAGGWGSWDDFYINKVVPPTNSNTSGNSGNSYGGGFGGTTDTTTPTESSKDDGNTTVIENPDGTTTETKTETTENESGNTVETTVTTEKDKDGNITGSREVSVIEKAAGKTSATVTVSKDAEGNVKEATADVTTVGTTSAKNVVGSISGKVVSQIAEAAGDTSVDITVNVTNSKGKTKYTITAASEDLTVGNKLKVVAVDPKTGAQILVNAKTYTVSKSGNVKVILPSGKDYALLTTKEAAAVEKAVLATVKVKKTSSTVETGKTTKVQMDSKLNMDNVASIKYSSSKKSIATVSKNGKVTAKKPGTVTIQATVTLNTGKIKKVTMKIKVKQ